MAKRVAWSEVKAAARRDGASLGAVPVEIVTSFTDSQPLFGWDTGHAMRELWQNFRDGLRTRFGPTVAVHRVAGKSKRFVAMLGSEEVGSLDCTHQGRLVLRQRECVLALDCLDLATTKRTENAIGGHGEGFKLGINLLLCTGFSVVYTMAYQTWTFSLRRVRSTRHHNMCVEVATAPDSDELVVTIAGPGAEDLFDPLIDLDLVEGFRVACDTPEYGQLFLSNEEAMCGRVYCRRLFVGHDRELHALKLSANLNLQIARDRHLVPNTMWPTIQNILEAACAHYGAHRTEPAGAAVFEHLLGILTKGTEDAFRKQLPFVKGVLRQYVTLQNTGAVLDRVMFLGQPSPSTQSLLRDLAYVVVTPAGALADPVNIEELMIEFIDKAAKLETSTLSAPRQQALAALGNLFRAMALTANSSEPQMIIKQLPAHVAAHTPRVYWIGRFRIVLDVTCLDDAALPYCANESAHRLRSIRPYCDFDRLLRRIATDFIREPGPYKFVAKKYVETVPAADTVPTEAPEAGNAAAASADAGGAARPNPRANGHGTSGTPPGGGTLATKTATPAAAAAAAADTGDDDGNAQWTQARPAQDPNSVAELVRKFQVADMQTEFTENDMPPKDEDLSPCMFTGTLLPIPFGLTEVLVDVRQLDQLSDGKLTAQLNAKLPAILQSVGHFQSTMAAALGMPLDHIPVVLVAVRPRLLGFTKSGCIYLNTVPLLPIASASDRNSSIFFTLVHELAHRAHAVHNTHFADDMAKLAYKLHHCLATAPR